MLENDNLMIKLLLPGANELTHVNDMFFWAQFQHEDAHFDGLLQERHNSSALAMELCFSCTNPSIY